ncbi:hypothetical protein [Azotobacter beijerinckii]|uniref:Uncharacterized protein n=1 Tax=Azotobacter beijerinckii TaxID=170623 RepID=A0A1I0ZX22_9GAMM|nr:hypothetical protein [Azotobacter beijerinckii]SFB30314.1 hypothetical protein SAMN04244571_02159 [Azotobacter beijerinckii]
MNLEGALAIIKADLDHQQSLMDASIRLTNYVYAHHRDIKHLSYSRIAQIIDTVDPETLLGVTQYCSGNRLSILKMKFELIIDNYPFELEDEDVFFAEENKYLIHPETGNPIQSYEEHVYPFFVPGDSVTHNE